MGAASFAASKIKLISLVYDSRCVPKSERATLCACCRQHHAGFCPCRCWYGLSVASGFGIAAIGNAEIFTDAAQAGGSNWLVQASGESLFLSALTCKKKIPKGLSGNPAHVKWVKL